MSSLIELRKQELATEVNEKISAVRLAISITPYQGLIETELNNVKNTLSTIEKWFDPKSDSLETFEKCKNELKELQREIEKIQARGETERQRLQRIEEARQKRLRKNAASSKYAGTWAGIGATLGGIVLGCGGCMSCVSHPYQIGDFPVTPFNTITGLLIGAIGGAVIGALIGAAAGQSVE